MDVDTTIEERLDEAYATFAATNSSYGDGFANHGPMAAEALIAMGGQRHLQGFVESYGAQLLPRPQGPKPIADPIAELGQRREWIDWAAYFGGLVTERSWREIAGVWVPRLVPGYSAAAGHGLLRVAHVLRSLERHVSGARLAELADALGYWCSTYDELEGSDPVGTLSLGDALTALPRLGVEVDRSGSISRLQRRATELDGWAAATAAASLPPHVSTLDQLALASVTAYAQFTPDAFTFLHGVTVPVMARSLVPYLGDDDWGPLIGAAWRFFAAAAGAFAPVEPLRSDAGLQSGKLGGRSAMVHHAGETRDDHTIKFVDACLTLAMRLGDAAPLHAADDRILRTSR